MPEVDGPAAAVADALAADGAELLLLLLLLAALAAAALRASAAATNEPPEEPCVDEAVELTPAPALEADAAGRG